MKIVKTDHNSKSGIYAKSHEIKTKGDWKKAKQIARDMSAWLNEKNGDFSGTHKSAYAIAHCQITNSSEPWKLFVVAKDLTDKTKAISSKQSTKDTFFEAQAIFNAEILEQPETLMKMIPQREVLKELNPDGTAKVKMKEVERKIDNKMIVPEGCMSFQYRKQRNTLRFCEIKVRYQYIGKLGLLKTFEGTVTGLKAHIIQHEVDHANAKNIFHNKK